MLVVLALIAMAMAISLPHATKSGDLRKLEALAETMTSELRMVRAKAMSENRMMTLDFDLKNRIVKLDGNSKPIVLPNEIQVSLLTAQDEKQDGQLGIKFYPEGGSSGGKIVLASPSSTREIDINWLTGAVVLQVGASQ